MPDVSTQPFAIDEATLSDVGEMSEPLCFEFDGGRIEPARNLVLLGGEVVTLEPRAMEVLAYLASHSGHVMSKDELLQSVWKGRWVTEDALSVYIYELRKALGDDARRPRFVETVRKRGYRWIPPVRVASQPMTVRDTAESDVNSASAIQATRARPGEGRWLLVAASVALVLAMAFFFRQSSSSGEFVTGVIPTAAPVEQQPDAELARLEMRRGDEYFRGRSPGDLLRAEASYLRATELDSELADAWGGLAMTYAMMAEYPMRDRFELYHQARRAADTSFEIDPNAAPAHVAMSMVRLVMDWDRVEARRHIVRALESGPDNSRAWEIRAWIESADGEYAAATSSLQRAIQLDPHSGYLNSVLAFVYGMSGDHEAMEATLDRAVELDAGNYLVYWYGWVTRWTTGDYEEAVPWLLESVRLRGRKDLADRLRSAYQEEGFSGFLLAYRKVIPDHASLMEQARIALYFDQPGRALDLLERAAAERDSALTWLMIFPDLQALHDEPRFQELIERVGGRV